MQVAGQVLALQGLVLVAVVGPMLVNFAGLSANLECMFEICAARGSLKIQDAKITPKIAICAPSHNFLGLYILN